MAFMTVKLVPGVRAEQTPLLLQAGVIQSNNVRWRDGLPEKIGGWKKFYPSALPGPVRELWTWEDLNGIDHLAAAGESTVTVLTGNAPATVTPLTITRNPSALATTLNSANVAVTDVGSNATTYESVTLQTPVAIGGIVISPGNYPIVSVTDANHYTIQIPQPPSGLPTASSTIAACTITSVTGSATFTVHLVAHGLSQGSNFSIVLPTTVGGVILSGFSSVSTVIDANNFTITAQNTATSTQTVNYGNVANPGIQLVQWVLTTQNPIVATISATAQFATGYQGIAMPNNPGTVLAGMTVINQTTGATLGTVKSYGPLSVSQPSAPFAAGNTTVNMAPGTNAPGIIPGMSITDTTVGSALGTVSSYVGNTLTLTAGAPFNAFYTITALGAFTTDYAMIYVPTKPSWVVADGSNTQTVTDLTTGHVLGLVGAPYGPNNKTDTVRLQYLMGDTSITMQHEGWRTALPGMKIFDLNQGGAVVGTVSSWIFQTLVLTAPSPITGGADTLQFQSTDNTMVVVQSPGLGPLPFNSAGASDVLGFGLTDTLTFSSGTNHVLVLNAPLTSSSFGASDVLAFLGVPPPPPVGSTPVPADDWCMFNFGSILLINPEDGPIFQYDPTAGLGGSQLVNSAPSKVHGMFLAMPEQMVVAYGASTQGVQDPMLVAWSDAGNFNTWILNVNNQAGTYRLSRGSRIVGGIQAPMQAMLWTDVGLWLMTYIGYPDVWGFSEIAQECGLIAKKAVTAIGAQVFWMGQDKFWTFTGGQVQPLPCEVWDAIFQNLNRDLVDLIRCYTDTAFDSVGWFFPSSATKLPGALQENDSFITFNRVTGEWDYGTPVDIYGDGKVGGIMVSDWTDANVFGNPISAMTNATGTQSQLMWMDMGHDADGQPIDWWIRTGLFMLSEGEDFLFVDRCRPDFRWRPFSSPTTPGAQIQITLYAQDDSDNPAKPPKVFGPFSVTETTGSFDPRARGRYFSLKVEGNDLGSFARLGAVKFRFAPDGRAG